MGRRLKWSDGDVWELKTERCMAKGFWWMGWGTGGHMSYRGLSA